MANIKQKMPKGQPGASTNPPATMGKASPITNNSTTGDQKTLSKLGYSSKDPARGSHKNGDFSQ